MGLMNSMLVVSLPDFSSERTLRLWKLKGSYWKLKGGALGKQYAFSRVSSSHSVLFLDFMEGNSMCQLRV